MRSPPNVPDLFRRMPTHQDALQWARRYGDDVVHAWVECHRADWLLFLAGILGADPKLVTLAACDCARFAAALLPEAQDEHALDPYLDVAERWTRGEATVEDCALAARRCLAIYEDPHDPGAPDEPPTAGYAASAVSAAVNVPTYRSAFGVACAAQAAAVAAAQVATPNDEEAIADAQRRCADLVRERIPVDALLGTSGFRTFARTVEPDAPLS